MGSRLLMHLSIGVHLVYFAPLKQTRTRILGDGNDAPVTLQLLQPPSLLDGAE